MTPFLWTMLGLFSGVLLVGFVALKLWTIQECKFRAEIETLETENGVLRMQVNRKPVLHGCKPSSTLPGPAGVDRGDRAPLPAVAAQAIGKGGPS